MNKIPFAWRRLSASGVALSGIVLLLSLPGSSAYAVDASSNKVLQGSVSLFAKVGDCLSKLGLHYHEFATATSSVLLVDDVTVGSAAFGRGIASGDCILSVKQKGPTYTLVIGRNGNLFSADLTALSATAAKVPANTLKGAAAQTGAVLTAQAPALAALPPTMRVLQVPIATLPVTQRRWPELNVKQNNMPMLDVDQKPFPVRQIAQEGPAGVDQGHFGDCWFEGTLAAFANVPRGQALIANMVDKTGANTYVVKFRGGNTPATTVTVDEARSVGLHDKSLWALLIEDACIRNYNPKEIAGNLSRGGGPAIQVAMELMTGVPATVARADQFSEQQLGSLLESLVRQQVPVSFSTKNRGENGGMPAVLTINHCYSLLDYSPACREVTLRNAFGYEPNYPDAPSQGVRSLGDGRVQIPLSLLPTYIRYIAYPSSNNY